MTGVFTRAKKNAYNKRTGYASTKKYKKSAKGKAASARYAATEKGRLSRRRSTLKQNYGWTLDRWEALFLSQGYRCAVPTCRADKPGSKAGWHTHHVERNGQKVVIGILCHHCNLALTKHMTPAHLRGLALFMDAYYVEA